MRSNSLGLVMSSLFDTGFYRSIRFVPADGGSGFQRDAPAAPLDAPGWFVALLPIESTPGVAQVSDSWRALGAVTVQSHSAYAHDQLWHGSQRSALTLAVVGVLAGLFGALVVNRMRRPLDQTVAQAQSLERGEYVTVEEPYVTEMRRLVRLDRPTSAILRVRLLKRVTLDHARPVLECILGRSLQQALHQTNPTMGLGHIKANRHPHRPVIEVAVVSGGTQADKLRPR